MNSFKGILKTLIENQVDFILIGGVAAVVHGSCRFTNDIDIIYKRSLDNYERIIKALTPYSPYLRGAPEGLPFLFDHKTMRQGLNFTLNTTLGAVDLFGEVPGNGTYESLVNHSDEILIFNLKCLCVNLETLIQLKRASGRAKDLEAISELEALSGILNNKK